MKTFNYKNALGLLLIVAALSTACDNEYGLFASIQEEVEQTSSKIFTDGIVNDVVYFDDAYYARLTHIFSRPVSGKDWTETNPAVFGSNYICSGIAVLGTKLYVSLRDKDTLAAKGVYTNTIGTGWSPSPVAAFNGKTVEAFFATPSVLFAMINESGNHELYQYDGSTLSPTALAGNSEFITGVVFDGSTYWASRGSKIYSDILVAATDVLAASANSAIRSLSSDGSSVVYASRKDGSALSSSSWSTVHAVTDDPLHAIFYVPIASPMVLMGVGGTGTGYYEATPALGSIVLGSSGTLATSTNYETTLKDKAIEKFYSFDDGTSVTLFACTASGSTGESALWSNKYTTSWSGWTAE